ncbi:MAG: RNA polymerase subunit sigma-70 [Cytophagales bacterium CG12_big_fil_rev_8_21_14_0_65_40_12]|nr:MAG: RNA polymerase subunit sigma-70 [Cytophagales bacterium CG12_big_fil_rev_8_21_14_0_65_40_12]PIW06300.1 MAG: RNA polymerase subunit sigma-70 [Cytophagales bacterium CG17_big_fil_post_rev_8_21_14_2_50_40_13]
MIESERNKIFDQWLARHKGLLFKVVRAYAFTPQDREDLFQEVVLQVWKSIPKFREESAVSTWLYRIALNVGIKWTTKTQRYQEMNQPMPEISPILKEMEIPDQRLIWLYEQIAQLNAIDRSLTLLLLDGFSYKEMAKMLGITESNVGVKINRFKKELMKRTDKQL